MKFSELKVGALFRFGGSKTTFTKITEDKCKDVLGGIYSSWGYAECMLDPRFQDSKTEKFDDLEMGTWFQYRNTRFIKTGPSEARRWGGNERCPFRNNETMKILTFEEVEK